MWHVCRQNGWQNVRLFSWPEHCRTYLTRVAACRMRHPQWQPETPSDDFAAGEDSLGDSINEFHESSLRLSADGDKNLDDLDKPQEQDELQDQVNRILSRIRRPRPLPLQNSIRKPDPAAIRRRRRLFVVALDSYDGGGLPQKEMVQVLHEVFRAVKSDPQWVRVSGFALSTAMPISETLGLLKSGRILPTDFDVIICSSGGELYYPCNYRWGDEDAILSPDPDYATHIEYRWDFDGVRNTLGNLVNDKGDEKGVDLKSTDFEYIAQVDPESCRPHCVSFVVLNSTKVSSSSYFLSRVDFLGNLVGFYGNCFGRQEGLTL